MSGVPVDQLSASLTPGGEWMIHVRAVRAGVAGGIHRCRGDEFACSYAELALIHDDPKFGWQEIAFQSNSRLAPRPAQSAHRLQPGAPLGDWSTLRAPTMPSTPKIM